MKIYECSPYFNEKLVANLKISESQNWIDELHIVESNSTFKGENKNYTFSSNVSNVKYHKIDKNHFKGKIIWKFRRKFPFFGKASAAWKNEEIQRNFACSYISPLSNDIVILNDIDEIIDSRHADKIVYLVKKHKIITIKLHFTMYYLNLFSLNWHELWPNSPIDYSYRVFIMNGDKFNTLKMTSNKLRRNAESGKFINSIYCDNFFYGFHHSWLGGYKAIKAKLQSYAHQLEDHSDKIYDKTSKRIVEASFHNLISANKSLFDGHKLVRRNLNEYSPLRSVLKNIKLYSEHII